MKPFFSNGIFTFDGLSITLVVTIAHILVCLLQLVIPQIWVVYVFEILFVILLIIPIMAIQHGKKPLLNTCFWIHIVLFIIGAILELSFMFYQLFHPLDDLTEALYKHGVYPGADLKDYIHQITANFYSHVVMSWTCWFVYLCALNQARNECREVSTNPLNRHGQMV